MYALASTLVESTYTGYNVMTFFIPLIFVIILMYSVTWMENGEYKKALRVLLGFVLVVGLIFSYVPFQTNATAELKVDEQPETYNIHNFDYDHEYNSDITIQVTDSTVDRVKVFGINDNRPTDEAERMQDNPKTTLEIPEDAESVVIITYDENGATVEETVVNVDVTEENVPILDFKLL